jgi:hypothetical protein
MRTANTNCAALILAGAAFWACSARADAGLGAAASYSAGIVGLADRVAGLLDRADMLIDKADAVAGCRLADARRIATGALAKLSALEDKAFHDLITLESKTVADLDDIVARRRRRP